MTKSQRKFRFGAQLSQADGRKQWIEQAKKAEDLGYETFFMPDHLGSQYSPLLALMTVAENTNLRIGTMVLDNDYRNPVFLARELATMDVLTEGRIEVGLGAGWMKSDYDESGIAYDTPAVRVSRFEEGLDIVTGLLSGEQVEFQGEYYKVNAKGRPACIQKPHPPILIGGGGRKVLDIAARKADILGINFNLKAGEVTGNIGQDGLASVIDDKLAWVKKCAGDRFDEIELQVLVYLGSVTDDRMGQAEMLGGFIGLDAEQFVQAPNAVVGTVDQIVQDLIERRERWGFSYVCFTSASYEAMGDVIARLRGI